MQTASDWRVRVGVLLGLGVALAFVGADSRRTVPAVAKVPQNHGPVLSDCDGAIRELVIHYVPEATGIVTTTYREFLRQLPEQITVYVVCPDQDAFDDLRARVGRVSCQWVAVPTGHAMTCWSRDRWLALAPARAGLPTLLLSQREETGSGVWPQRRGDTRIGDDLAAALADHVVSSRSNLAFDGGDFVVDSDTVFVTPRVLQHNAGVTVSSSGQLRQMLSEVLGRKVVLLPEAPAHHAGMFMMPAGSRTVVIGDPSMASKSAGALPSFPIEDPDFSDETQRRFDAVAAQCAAAGYCVVRIPVVPDRDGRTYLTYLNVILDQRDGTRTVYMPVYRNAERLNDAAAAVWRELGYQVRPVDCTETYRHFGSLRCLVNVLRRSSPD